MMSFGIMGIFGLLGLLFTVGIITGIVILIVWVVKDFNAHGKLPTSGQSAREILQARFARGEITREQYQQMLSDLS